MARDTGIFRPVVFPFKSEHISFSLSHKSSTAPNATIDLCCVAFDRECRLIDYIHPGLGRDICLGGALRHCGSPGVPRGGGSCGVDAALYMFPFEMWPQCEVVLIIVSSPRSPLQRNDLIASVPLQLTVNARELGRPTTSQLLDINLANCITNTASTGTDSQNSGHVVHHTMLVGALYTTPGGWTLSLDGSTFPHDCWGALLPELRARLTRWPELSAAEHARDAPGPGTAIFSRPGKDRSLVELFEETQEMPVTAQQHGDGVGGVSADSVSHDAGSEKRQTATAAACLVTSSLDAGGAGASAPQTLFLELGWQLHPRAPLRDDDDDDGQGNMDDDADEPPTVEFALTLHNLKGEDIGTANVDGSEVEGVTLVDLNGEQEQEQGQEQEQPLADENKGNHDESNGSNSLVEAGEPANTATSKEAVLPLGAAHPGAAAATAASPQQGAYPLEQPFPLQRRLLLSLGELPRQVHAALLTMSCLGGNGFKRIRSLQARLLAPVDANSIGSTTAGRSKSSGAQMATSSGNVSCAAAKSRVLLHYRFDSPLGEDEALTQLLVLKLYRERQGSAFETWAAAGEPDLTALVPQVLPTAAVAAAGEVFSNSDGSSCVSAGKTLLQGVLAEHKKLECELQQRAAQADVEGEEEEEEQEEGSGPDLRLMRGSWRVRVLGRAAGGSGPDDVAELVASLLAYDGQVDGAGQRVGPVAKVVYPNRDSYYGGYSGTKAGAGLYIAASGAAHIGRYEAGKRHGRGLMVLPDGALYLGGFAADLFDGEGTYQYPDGSRYTGMWRAGRRHGPGTYYDADGGVLAGEWAAGVLAGRGSYDTPHHHFEGTFVAGLPAGPCAFTLGAYRATALPQPAASNILACWGPTLQAAGTYILPAGAAAAAAEYSAVASAGENGTGDDGGEGSALPVWPHYEGMTYEVDVALPKAVPDVPFPPVGAPLAVI